jgi:hypothetical protein
MVFQQQQLGHQLIFTIKDGVTIHVGGNISVRPQTIMRPLLDFGYPSWRQPHLQ